MSNAERQKRYRDAKRNAPKENTLVERIFMHPRVTQRVTVESPPQDAPQSTNGGGGTPKVYGKSPIPRLMAQPEQRARKVAIPGDADYEGCCKQVGGEWQVDSTKPNIKGMSDDELVRRLHFITDWKQSPEHKEILRRRVA